MQTNSSTEDVLRELSEALLRFEASGAPVTPEIIETYERFEALARAHAPTLPAFAVSV